MYEVYSAIRAGKPRWTIAASVFLLLFSTGFAAYVAQQRSASAVIVLGEAKSYEGIGLRARLPIGWDIAEPITTEYGEVMEVAQPGEDSGRQLLLFRTRSRDIGLIPLNPETALEASLQAAIPNGRIGLLRRVGASMIGGYRSDVYQMLISTRLSPQLLGLANVAVSPDRQIFGVILLIDGDLTSRDRKLFKDMSENLVLEQAPSQPARPGKPTGPGKPAKPINHPDRPVVLGDGTFFVQA